MNIAYLSFPLACTDQYWSTYNADSVLVRHGHGHPCNLSIISNEHFEIYKKNMWFVTFFATIYNRCFSSFLYDKFLIFSRISIQIRAHLSCFIEIFSVNSKWLLISWNCFRAKEYLTRPFLVMLATNCTSSHGGKRKLSDFFYLKDFEFFFSECCLVMYGHQYWSIYIHL